MAEEKCLQQETRKQWLLKTEAETDTLTCTETERGMPRDTHGSLQPFFIKVDLHRCAHTQTRCFCPSWLPKAPRGQAEMAHLMHQRVPERQEAGSVPPEPGVALTS